MPTLTKNQKVKPKLSNWLTYVPILATSAFILCLPATTYAIDCKDPANKDKLQCNPIVLDTNSIVNFLSVGVGIIVVGVLIMGGIQYMAAGDNPQVVSAAKKRIANALLALLAFIFTFAFLQWLIPGGVFN